MRTNHRVLGFIDNNRELDGSMKEGLPVISFQNYYEQEVKRPVLVSTNLYTNDILNQYDSDEILMMSFKAYFYFANEASFRKLEFSDKKSFETLNGMINSMVLSDDDYLKAVSEDNEYHALPGFYGNFAKTYIDCGAYTGDSVERFIWSHGANFERIIAFEPGSKQFAAMEKRIERLISEWALKEEQIVLVNAAVGSQSKKITYIESSDLSGSRTDETGIDGYLVFAHSLDEYLEEDICIDFIKADIEGAECEMLQGAERTIRRWKPSMAICVYHKPDDLLRIYDILKRYVPEYKFALRQHSSRLAGTVLYAWI